MNTAEVDRILQKQVEETRTPSLHYVVFNSERIIHRFFTGLADVKVQQPTRENTVYHAYSITKTFIALAVLQLAERGLLHIDEPVKKYLPSFPYSGDITIQQLLSHSAGIPNPIPLSWIHLEEEHETFNEKEFFNGIFANNPETKFAPNEKFAYSNLGYILLGWLIEAVAGIPYEQYVTESILDKLNIQPQQLSFRIHNQAQYAKGYHKQLSVSNFVLGFLLDKNKYMLAPEGKWKPFKSLYINGAAYGGLIGAPDAFVNYIRALLKKDSPLLSNEYKQKLFTENHTNSGRATGMCLSWYKAQMNGTTFYTHAGGGGGYYCELRIYPEHNTGSVIMFNRTGMIDERFLSKVDGYFLV